MRVVQARLGTGLAQSFQVEHGFSPCPMCAGSY